MRSKQLDSRNGEKTLALVFEKGEEVISALQDYAERTGLDASEITGVGGFSQCTLGFFNRKKLGYQKIPVSEQAEVLSLLGNVTLEEDVERKVHLHAVLGLPDGTTRGGHVLEARVWPTLELIVREAPGYLRRRMDRETGLALIDLEREPSRAR